MRRLEDDGAAPKAFWPDSPAVRRRGRKNAHAALNAAHLSKSTGSNCTALCAACSRTAQRQGGHGVPYLARRYCPGSGDARHSAASFRLTHALQFILPARARASTPRHQVTHRRRSDFRRDRPGELPQQHPCKPRQATPDGGGCRRCLHVITPGCPCATVDPILANFARCQCCSRTSRTAMPTKNLPGVRRRPASRGRSDEHRPRRMEPEASLSQGCRSRRFIQSRHARGTGTYRYRRSSPEGCLTRCRPSRHLLHCLNWHAPDEPGFGSGESHRRNPADRTERPGRRRCTTDHGCFP